MFDAYFDKVLRFHEAFLKIRRLQHCPARDQIVPNRPLIGCMGLCIHSDNVNNTYNNKTRVGIVICHLGDVHEEKLCACLSKGAEIFQLLHERTQRGSGERSRGYDRWPRDINLTQQ